MRKVNIVVEREQRNGYFARRLSERLGRPVTVRDGNDLTSFAATVSKGDLEVTATCPFIIWSGGDHWDEEVVDSMAKALSAELRVAR